MGSAAMVGSVHKKDPVSSNVGKSTAELNAAALETTAAVAGTDITSGARFAGNPDDLLKQLLASTQRRRTKRKR